MGEPGGCPVVLQWVLRLSNDLGGIGGALLLRDHLHRLQRLLPEKDLYAGQPHRNIPFCTDIGVINIIWSAVVAGGLAPCQRRRSNAQHPRTTALVGRQVGAAPANGIGDKNRCALHRQRRAGGGKLKNQGGITEHSISSLCTCDLRQGRRGAPQRARAARKGQPEGERRGAPPVVDLAGAGSLI